MSHEEFNHGQQMGIIITKLEAIETKLETLEKDVAELKNTRSKFFMALAWASGLGISGGALGGKIAHVAGWLEPK